MKGIILAGGKGTRLYPLTKVTNKHLLPVGKEPMIFHSIKQLISCDIRDILIVTSTVHMGDVVNLLGSGKEFNCEFTYRVQEEANGIAAALALGKGFAGGDNVVVLLGDNIFEYSIAYGVKNFQKQNKGARVFLKEVDDPHRFGIAALDEQKIIEIEEKPSHPKTNYAVVGAYCFDNEVFSIIDDISPSERGEYEISDVINEYIKRSILHYEFVKGAWADAGTFESLAKANEILLRIDNQIITEG